MIPDRKVREILGSMGIEYAASAKLAGPYHKSYTGGGLLVALKMLTGSKIDGYETFDNRVDRVFDGHELYSLVTREQNEQYQRERDAQPSPFTERAVSGGVAVRRANLNARMIREAKGPIVESVDDINLETAVAESLIVQYLGTDVNAEYLDTPWWRRLVEDAKAKYGVDRGQQESLEYRNDEPLRGGLILHEGHHHTPRQRLYFTADATTEEEAEAAIRDVWRAGSSVKNAIDGETSRLQAYLQ